MVAAVPADTDLVDACVSAALALLQARGEVPPDAPGGPFACHTGVLCDAS
jgi:hypothetical protein